jgi:hypothetical protein
VLAPVPFVEQFIALWNLGNLGRANCQKSEGPRGKGASACELCKSEKSNLRRCVEPIEGGSRGRTSCPIPEFDSELAWTLFQRQVTRMEHRGVRYEIKRAIGKNQWVWIGSI